MFTVELYAKVRHAVMIEGLSCREAAKRFGIHRNTITKMLSFSVPPGYRRRERPASRAQADRDTRWAIEIETEEVGILVFSKSLRFALPIWSIASVAML
jgi:transposase